MKRDQVGISHTVLEFLKVKAVLDTCMITFNPVEMNLALDKICSPMIACKELPAPG